MEWNGIEPADRTGNNMRHEWHAITIEKLRGKKSECDVECRWTGSGKMTFYNRNEVKRVEHKMGIEQIESRRSASKEVHRMKCD